ncbi:DUF5333 domain-containing protein [Rhodobacter sp. KR11]|uniref:DUF5333 domain-containing protein n=1 Tax=Rhodobacter sp. KR11 TaxID=2974588 RepID=UPI002223B84B|nr:DUF5333 domain-containing protein [Rhodobacter sp. KR11]MCW1919613.1 DUF5333 domain-containing protein [Rhodobacter sp. KR11]
MRAALILAFLAFPAFADDPRIAADTHVTEVLTAARLGDVIRTTCPTIKVRWFAVWSEMEALKSHARAQGYAEPDVKAFLADKGQKARIAALAAAALQKAGAKANDPETYCVIGRDQIARQTLAGQLLRASP